MKFERLLQLYWARGFLYGGRTSRFNVLPRSFFRGLPGQARFARNLFFKRFEFALFFKKNEIPLSDLSFEFCEALNTYLSQIISINNNIHELTRVNVIRLYLLKTFRGRAQALGKPSRGQRTGSNAGTSHKYNKTLRNFINELKSRKKVVRVKENLNRKKVQKKYRKIVSRVKRDPNRKKINVGF